MTFRRMILILTALLFLTGCHRVTVGQDYHIGYNFSDLRTFQWFVPAGQLAAGQLANPFLDARVRTAVERALIRRGYQVAVDGRPDFMVTYHHKVRQRVESTPLHTGFGFGTGRRGAYTGVGFGTGVGFEQYDQGVLVIDLIRPGSGDLIWRGTGTRRIVHTAGPEEAAAEINETVDRILSQFPPGRKPA